MKLAAARFLAFLAVIVCTIPVYAQSTGSFTGIVTDRDGKPIAGATVSFERKEVGYRSEVKTDNKGLYIRTGLDDGNYQITVMQNGVPVASSNEAISLGFRVDKNFDLRALDKQQQSQNSAANTGAGNAPISRAQSDAETKANTDTQGAFNAGLNALRAGNLDEAIKQFNLANERKPNLPVTYNRLGESYMAGKKYNEAADAWKKATELKGDDPDYFYNFGIASAQARRFDEAKKAIQKAVEIEPPRGGVAYFNLGMLLEQGGQTTDAIDALQRSIKQNPKTGETYYQLGLLLMKSTATIGQSVQHFEKYLQLEPKGKDVETAKALAAAAKEA